MDQRHLSFMVRISVVAQSFAFLPLDAVSCRLSSYTLSQYKRSVRFVAEDIVSPSLARVVAYRIGYEKIKMATMLWMLVILNLAVDSMSLSSLDAPRVQKISFPSRVSLGDPVAVVCVVTQTTQVRMTWSKNGHEMKAGNGISISAVSDFVSALSVQNTRVEDIGNYTCEASNSAGRDSATASLLVSAAPVWTAEPNDAEAIQGKDLLLPCGSVGYPQPSTIWKMQIGGRDFVPVPSLGRLKVLDNGTLLIRAVESDDAGLYTCDVSNSIEPSLSKTIRITVHVPPRIGKGTSQTSVKRGDIAKIACDVTGEHPLVVTWEKAGKKPLIMSMERYESHEDVTPSGVRSVLVIHSTAKEDDTQYYCVATNNYGASRDAFTLIVLEPPASPSNVVVPERGSRHVLIKWSHPSSQIAKYLVRYWKKSSKGSVLEERQVDGTRATLTVSHLHPGTEYAAVVLAENSVGFGDPSDVVSFTTASEAPSAPPMNVKCEAIDTKTIQIVWEPPPTDKLNGDLRGYQISYRLDGTPFSHETVGRSSQHKLFTGLRAASFYTFMAKAFNDVGHGPASQQVSCATLNGDPPSVPSVRVTGITSSSVSLNWNTMQSSPSIPVIQYVIQYGTDDGQRSDLHLPGSKDSVTLRDLRSGTRYNFRLAAYNLYGRGDFSHNLPAVTHLSDGRAMQVTTESQVPFYYRTYFVVPVAASFTVIVTALVIAWACLKRATIIQKSTPLISGYARGSYAPTIDHSSHAAEEAYDIPWDGPRAAASTDGSYARLKSQGKRNVV